MFKTCYLIQLAKVIFQCMTRPMKLCLQQFVGRSHVCMEGHHNQTVSIWANKEIW